MFRCCMYNNEKDADKDVEKEIPIHHTVSSSFKDDDDNDESTIRFNKNGVQCEHHKSSKTESSMERLHRQLEKKKYNMGKRRVYP